MGNVITAQKLRIGAPELKRRAGDGGIDVAMLEDKRVKAGESIRVPSGYAFQLPHDWHLLALQKSRYAGVLLVEAPLIDSTYRGEVHLCIHALQDIYLVAGVYVVQLLPVYSPHMEIEYVGPSAVLSETERGDGAFGSTG